ncbi:MAG: molybdate ABC transporter substrate-binding protein [Methylobacterium sp.]|nr:molybdate ABC transporter substrate-binding protein [Methylobacterium sp.]
MPCPTSSFNPSAPGCASPALLRDGGQFFLGQSTDRRGGEARRQLRAGRASLRYISLDITLIPRGPVSTRRSVLALALAASTGFPLPAAARSSGPVVFAAASLKTALDEIATLWMRETGLPAPRLAYAGSNALARQIEQGAPADLFLSADLDWMDALAAKNLLRPETRSNLLANRLALVAPVESKATITLQPGADLAVLLADGRLATANVDSVPAGKYAKAAFEKLGLWVSVKDRLAQTENVRAALLLVARGEASLGVTYATDAAAEPKARIIALFPEESHPPIVYPIAMLRDSAHPQALRLLEFLKGGSARAIFERHGFTLPAPHRQGS